MQPFAFSCSLVACRQIDSWDALMSDIPPAITVFFQGSKQLLQRAHAVPALNTLLATRVPQLISLLNVLADCSPEHARTQTVAALQRPTAEQDLQVRTCKRVVSRNCRLNPVQALQQKILDDAIVPEDERARRLFCAIDANATDDVADVREAGGML
jgi:hypothetical protein